MHEPVDTKFFAKYRPVAVAAIGDMGGEALLARAMLEHLRAVVHLHLIGCPTDFLEVLRQGEDAPPYLVICSHGDENGLVFGEYAPYLDTSMLVEESMPPQYIAENINLPGCVVVDIACLGGTPKMAQAFMKGGLRAYIGSTEGPRGTTTPLFVAHFFHALFCKGRSVREAWEHAASYDDDSRHFVLYDGDGVHTVKRS
jgi:hypothetical protein